MMSFTRMGILASCAALVAVGSYTFLGEADQSTAPVESAGLPQADMAATEIAGEALFNTHCAACHGAGGAGSDKGPPLVHKIYEPSHHGDIAFLLAARQGVRGHHWQFGNMPPVEGVTEDDVTQIVSYVRAVQRANGIN